MNKIDILLNAIARQHLGVEVVLPVDVEDETSYKRRLYSALLCAFTNGVQHATSLSKNSTSMLCKEFDTNHGEIDSAQVVFER